MIPSGVIKCPKNATSLWGNSDVLGYYSYLVYFETSAILQTYFKENFPGKSFRTVSINVLERFISSRYTNVLNQSIFYVVNHFFNDTQFWWYHSLDYEYGFFWYYYVKLLLILIFMYRILLQCLFAWYRYSCPFSFILDTVQWDEFLKNLIWLMCVLYCSCFIQGVW